MANSVNQVEKNVQASFGYVKKDLLMLNDAVSDIHDKIQHLSLNHATLLGEIQNLRSKLGLKAKPKKVKAKAKKAKNTHRTVKPKTKAKKASTKSSKKSTKKIPKKIVKETITYS
jgi:hypothetical protein